MSIPNIEHAIERFESYDGTYIATAAWGDVEAPTVMNLERFVPAVMSVLRRSCVSFQTHDCPFSDNGLTA